MPTPTPTPTPAPTRPSLRKRLQAVMPALIVLGISLLSALLIDWNNFGKVSVNQLWAFPIWLLIVVMMIIGAVKIHGGFATKFKGSALAVLVAYLCFAATIQPFGFLLGWSTNINSSISTWAHFWAGCCFFITIRAANRLKAVNDAAANTDEDTTPGASAS